jgi:hypothetical protein
MSRLSCFLVCWALAGAGPVLGQKAEPKAERPTYELRMVRVGNTFQGIRFKPATGETWLIVGPKWEPLEESGPVPAGDYDITLVATEEAFSAFRFDRKAGTTWILKERKWVKLQEPKEL